jgi:hypothetical protein
VQTYLASVMALARKPSALVPLAMSTAALLLVIGVVSSYGIVRDPDEGTAAHVWQLLMLGQFPFLAWFAIKWLPRERKAAPIVLALLLLTAVVAAAPVAILSL